MEGQDEIRLALSGHLTACVSSLTFCGNVVPLSDHCQGDLMNVEKRLGGSLWKTRAAECSCGERSFLKIRNR
jgi:hypothetical protein